MIVMGDWKPYGGPRNDETKELCPECEGSSECPGCDAYWIEKLGYHPPRAGVNPNCSHCGGTFECPNCDGTGLVDA